MAHLMAPKANLVLAETPVAETEGTVGFPPIVKAENTLINQGVGDVFSQSFGATEETFPSKASMHATCARRTKNARRHHVTMLASSGDSGSAEGRLDGTFFHHPGHHLAVQRPAGDQRRRNTAEPRCEREPDRAGQRVERHPGRHRRRRRRWALARLRPAGVPAPCQPRRPRPLDARHQHERGGERRRDRVPELPAAGQAGFYIVGGTSEASPLFSGVVAIADQIAHRRLGWINPAMYRLDSGIVDITRGSNTFLVEAPNGSALFSVPGWNAVHGYDMASGLGTVDGFEFAHALAASG